jgi:hypothetical protein
MSLPRGIAFGSLQFITGVLQRIGTGRASVRRSHDFRIARGAFFAACGGENRPNYFKNIPPKNSHKILFFRSVSS